MRGGLVQPELGAGPRKLVLMLNTKSMAFIQNNEPHKCTVHGHK